MAEFQVVAKELERMCNTYHAASGKCGTDECPLYCEDLCYALSMVHVHGDDAGNLEKAVMLWAAEHPEPVYPTWREWLLANRIIGDADSDYATGLLMRAKRIPADIAQKLGIEPLPKA